MLGCFFCFLVFFFFFCIDVEGNYEKRKIKFD